MNAWEQSKFLEKNRALLIAAIVHNKNYPKSFCDQARHEDGKPLLRLPCGNEYRETIRRFLRHLLNMSHLQRAYMSKEPTWMSDERRVSCRAFALPGSSVP